MKQLLVVASIFIGATLMSHASTRSDVKVLEASENIKYITQKIAKNYLFFYTHQNKKEIKLFMKDSIEKLGEEIQSIAIATQDKKVKNILDYVAYEKEQLKITVEDEISGKNAALVLDFSQAVTEAAIRIAKTIKYDFSEEEKMLILSKSIEYRIEKLTKFYMVLGSDIDKTTVMKKMEKNISEVNVDFEKIKKYAYPDGLNDKKRDLEKLWNISKSYYTRVNSHNIPNIILISTDGIKSIIDEISLHHSKGQ